MQSVCFTFVAKVSKRLWGYEKYQNIEVWKGLGRVIMKCLLNRQWYTIYLKNDCGIKHNWTRTEIDDGRFLLILGR